MEKAAATTSALDDDIDAEEEEQAAGGSRRAGGDNGEPITLVFQVRGGKKVEHACHKGDSFSR